MTVVLFTCPDCLLRSCVEAVTCRPDDDGTLWIVCPKCAATCVFTPRAYVWWEVVCARTSLMDAWADGLADVKFPADLETV